MGREVHLVGVGTRVKEELGNSWRPDGKQVEEKMTKQENKRCAIPKTGWPEKASQKDPI